jgi:16S rRNA processing protein RimM
MINKENCLLLGTLTKPHGIKGSLFLWLNSANAIDIKKRDSVFVEIDGLLVPFFIENFKINSAENALIKFEEVDSETKAKAFAEGRVYVLKNAIRKRRKAADVLPSFSGYKVIDRQLGFIGTAGEINEIANNPLLQVMNGNKEFLIPAHEDIILEINEKDREIYIDAPEGLFDL